MIERNHLRVTRQADVAAQDSVLPACAGSSARYGLEAPCHRSATPSRL